jgi:aspartate dehydrogenase
MHDIRVAIAGLGAIGRTLAKRLDAGMPGLKLACAAAGDRAKAQAFLEAQGIACPLVGLDEFPMHADIAVECAPATLLDDICRPMLAAGKSVIVLSCGALLPRPDLIELARANGGSILVPTGALLGLDAVRAAAQGTIESVTMVTRKPPRGLAGAPHLAANGIVLDGLSAPLKVFDGSAREGARGFPANVNVAAALSLAGIGPDRTRLEIWADPNVTRNTHRIVVEADSARFEMTIENVPSEDNPRTGKITALSMIAALISLRAPLKVGT